MIKTSKRLLVLLLVGIIVVSLSGCEKSTQNTTDTLGKTNTTGKTNGDRYIKLGINADLTSLDPHKHNDIESATATRSIYETLIKLNSETNEFDLHLAKSYEYIEGSNNEDMKFELNEGIKFHNGNPLTAEDVKFSLERQKSSGNVGHLVALIDSVEVIDELTFIIHLKEQTSTILSSLSHMGCSILNKEHVEKMDKEGKGLDTDPIGTGPFKFGNWVLGSEYTLVKYEDYWNDSLKAQSDGLIFKVIPEETSRTVALEANEIDVLLVVPNIDVKNVEENKDIELTKFVSTQLNFLALNASKEPFNNKLLREAVAHCINREDIIKVQFNGHASPVHTAIGPAAIGFTDDVKKYKYDIEMAKDKLKEAGVPEGFSFTISTNGPAQGRACEVIQSACKKAGIDVKIEVLEVAAYYDKTGKGDHEAGYSLWVANAEPDNTYRPLFSSSTIATGGSNYSCFKSDEIDKLLQEGSKIIDNDAKVEKYEEIAKIVAEEAVMLGVASEYGFIANQETVDGMIISPILMHDYYGLHFVK